MGFAELVSKYALPSIVMALIVMTIIGIVKVFTKVLKKQVSDKYKAWMGKLYLLLSLVLSFGVVAAYNGIFKIEFIAWTYLKDSAVVYSCTQALYSIYENVGGRTLLLKIFSLFKGKNKEIDTLLSAIEEIVILTDGQREELKHKLSA